MDGHRGDWMWVDEAQFEDRLIEAMTRPLTGPGSASSPPPLLVAHPPLEWVPARGPGSATEELLMLRMVDGEGSILHYGMLRDGHGFACRSGYGWSVCDFRASQMLAHVEMAEEQGYHIDFGPVSFPIPHGVALSVRHGRFVATDAVLLEGFQAAGAPNI